jgi:hypothetical protein
MQPRSIFTAAAAALIVCAGITPVFAQTEDGAFKVRYAANVLSTDTVINMVNTGASIGYSTGSLLGIQTNTSGNMCVNVYVFSPDEQLQTCCSCFLSPNALGSFSAQNDFNTSTLTGVKQNSFVIKLVATMAPANKLCDPTTAGQGASVLIPGLAAWARGNGGETPFTNSTLSAGELAHATLFCGFNQQNGSGPGVCATTCKHLGQ